MKKWSNIEFLRNIKDGDDRHLVNGLSAVIFEPVNLLSSRENNGDVFFEKLVEYEIFKKSKMAAIAILQMDKLL